MKGLFLMTLGAGVGIFIFLGAQKMEKTPDAPTQVPPVVTAPPAPAKNESFQPGSMNTDSSPKDHKNMDDLVNSNS